MKEIDAMVEALVRRRVVAESDRDKALAALRAVWADRVALVWTTTDVIRACPLLTDQEARAVLGAVLMGHDRAIGVNTDTLVEVATRLFGERALMDEEDEDEDEGT